MGKLRFCQQFVYLNRQPIRFDARHYFPAVYAVTDRNLVLRCSGQTEKSTFLVNTILYEACKNPGIQMLFVCPRIEQARVFSHSRLPASLEQSPLIRRALLGRRARRPQVMNMQFANGSTLFVRAAYHSADSCRGDTTVTEHPGDKVYGKGKHRNAVRSSHTFTAWLWGHKWVVLALAVPIPLLSRRWRFCPPFTGDVAIVTNTFELYTDYGVQIKARSPAVQTFVIQRTGSGGYLPGERAVRGGGYDAVIQSSRIGPEGGQVLVDRTVKAIKAWWSEAK